MARYINRNQLKKTSDEEIIKFFEETSFEGIYSSEIKSKNTDFYKGSITDIKLEGRTTNLAPFFLNVPRSSNRIPEGPCSFKCKINIEAFREEPSRYILNLVGKSLVSIESFSAPNINVSSKHTKEQDLFEMWGVNNCQCIGFYHYDEENEIYVVDDLRKPNFDHIPYYPGDADKKPIRITYPHEIRGIKPNDYYLFTWKLSHRNTFNPYEIFLDFATQPQPIDPKWFIDTLFDDRHNDKSKNFGSAANFLDTLSKQLSAKESTFVYELLQNANDYPVEGKMVDVEFYITDNYLLFLHSGEKFNVRNISGICGINEKEKTANKKTIGYKGIGFKTVFLQNHYVYLRTGDYSFRFDEGETPEKKVGGKIRRLGAPFQILPIWTGHNEVATEVNDVFDTVNRKFKVKIALRPNDKKLLHVGRKSYENLFKEVFSDSNIILFIPNINSVRVIINGKEEKLCVRNNDEWIVGDYEEEIDFGLQELVNKTIEKGNSRIPEKYKDFECTKVSFACKHKGAMIEPVDKSILYCYLPTSASWGFPFLMNTDMIPKGDRNDIEKEVTLIGDEERNFNQELAAIAGTKLFCWIKDLLTSKKYQLGSVFSLIPDFRKCIKEHDTYDEYIRKFGASFDECIENDQIVPVCQGIANVKKVILDTTGLTSSNILTDEEFYKFSGIEDSYLPLPMLRKDKHFNSFLKRYADDEQKFTEDNLPDLIANSDFQDWLSVQENNDKFLSFLLEKDLLENFCEERIFLGNNKRLYSAGELFYDIDKYLADLQAFEDCLSYLSPKTREFFNDNQKWDDAIDGAFAKFDCNDFINDILLDDGNLEVTVNKLHDKDTSIHFYNFLSQFVEYKKEFLDLPFIAENDVVVSDFKDKFIFMPSTQGEEVCSSKWLQSIDKAFLSKEYSEKTKQYLCENFGVKEFSNSIIINDIVLSKVLCSSIISEISTDISINKEFINYLFENKNDIHGIEMGSGEDKTTDYNRCSNYGLFFVNGNDEQLYLEASDERAFYSIKSDYLEYEWFDNSWIYTLSTQYHTGYSKTKIKEFASFLKKYFGISDMNDGRCKNIAISHVDEIKVKTSSDIKVNLSFWDFLGKFQWSSNSKDLELFRSLPVLDVKGKNVNDIASKTNLYYYEKELEDINNSTWIQEDLITILSPVYTLTKNLISLFDLFGFKKYIPQHFAHFFENVIVNQAIPKKVPEEVKATAYNVSLDTEEKCADFHCFMSKKYTLLNDIDKALLKGTPVYVYGKENPRRLEVGYGSYILGDDKFGVIKQCESGLLPEINALDSSFVTDDNLTYWTDVQGCVTLDEESLCLWIEQNAASIGQTLRDNSSNTVFWTWLFDLGINSQNKIGRLKSLPIIFFTARDADNNEDNLKVSSLIDTEVYMANSYMGNAQIEDFARKHGKTNFVSSIYVRETDNNENWRRFFRNLGVKDDVKDVIYSIIMNDLPTIKDKKLPWVLVDQYSKELADPEKWAELAPKLRELQVETTTEGVFVSLANALRITVDDYSKKEPFKMVKLTGEISRDYYQDENVKNLINKIAEEAKTKKIAELQQWFTAKVNQFFTLQDSLPDDEFREIHFSFIKELFGYTEHLERNKIMLYDRDWQLTKSDELYLGSKYDCKCNFEKFGIAKKYVHDEYLQLGKVNDCSRVLRSIGCQDRFKEDDIKYLTDRDFSIYFWCKYVGAKDITIFSSVNSWVKDGKFNNVACIPSESGDVKRACELYSSSLADYMKYIPNYPQKIIDKRMLFTEPLVELCKQCLEHLTIGDIIAFLLNSKPKNRNRTIALQWLLDDTSEDKETWLTTYIAHEKACWLNGQGEPVHLSSLLAIDPNNCNQAYVFKSSPSVIDISYFPQDNELDVCQMFGITVFSDDDLVPKPVTTPDSGQTLKVSREIIRRLLLVIAYRYRYDWSDMFIQMKQKIQDAKFMLCESISYGYNDLSIDNEDFYFDNNSKTFYYVDSWQDKKVYESFINKLCEFLSMDLDYRECKGKLDENFNGKKVANYLNQNCRDLFYDEEFVAAIKQYWSDIVSFLEIKVDDEPEIDDDEIVEEIIQEKYYEDELNEEQPENQEESLEIEPEEKQSTEEIQTDSTTKNTQTTEASKTSSSHDANRTIPSDKQTDSASESDVSKESHEEHDKNIESKAAAEKKESSESERLENPKNGSSNSGTNKSRQSNASTQRKRLSNYEPKAPTEEEIRRLKYQSSTKTFATEDMQDNEYEALNKILGEGLSPEEIVTENYLAQLRFWSSLKENDMVPADISMEDFVRNNQKDCDYELTNGKYVHRCSARGGLLHISPKIWNKVADDRCIICVFVGAKVNEFFYIRNKKELLDWIAEDAIVIKLTGSEKVEAVNRLYSEILMDTNGTAYTLIRVAYNESYNSLFSDIESNDFGQTDINDADYGD